MWLIQESNTLELWNKLHFEEERNGEYITCLTFSRRNYFLILAQPVYKMWIIQEPNTLELWNTLHFEDKKGEYIPCLTYWCRNYFFNFSTPCIWNVNNIGTKYVRIMKQNAFGREKKWSLYTMFKIFSTYICWINI